MRRPLAITALVAASLGLAAPPAAAQFVVPDDGHARPFMAFAQRDLSFGQVFPGIPESVLSSDPRQAGLFEIQGTPESPVRVEFVLPSALQSSHGALLPIEFRHGDGQADFSRGRFRGVFFDPRTPLVADLGPNGKLWVRLGGTVLPTRDQAGGAYYATISITVFDLGI
jgi:hypothetical protein